MVLWSAQLSYQPWLLWLMLLPFLDILEETGSGQDLLDGEA